MSGGSRVAAALLEFSSTPKWYLAHPDGRLAVSDCCELARERAARGQRAIDRVVHALAPHLRGPIETCLRWAPRVKPRQGTFILRDVESLNANEQRSLLSWLDDVGAAVQVIAVVSAPLFPQVLERRFLDALYYRLNILYITVDDAFTGGAT